MTSKEFTRDTLYIDGAWVSPLSASALDVMNPSTGEAIGTAVDAGPGDVEAAVSAARAAHERGEWRGMPAAARAGYLDALATELAQREDRLNELAAIEAGRPIGPSRGHPSRPAEILRYFAAQVRGVVEEEIRPVPDRRPFGSVRSLVRRQPVGVTAAIVPYNASVLLAMHKIAPALGTGGSVVVKTPPQAPLELYEVAAAAAAVGIPAGVLNVISGGRGAGQALVAHPDIDKVAFTGSTASGRAIAEVCARRLKAVTLELGGKSAAVLLDDADVQAFTRSLPFIGFAHSGQSCFINSRILAPASRYEEVVEAVTEFVRPLLIGDAIDPATSVGPMIREEHRARVESYIESGLAQGAKATIGGPGGPGRDRGWFVNPTVFRDARNDMVICQEEIFGPVLAVIPYDTEERAVSIANDSEFGLAGTVWTADPGRGVRIAAQIRTGTVGVNGFGFNSAAPFGGRKSSGVGTELGPEGLDAYLERQVVHLP